MLKNVFFDTCVYHLPGIELLAKVIPVDNILFASEMLGAVKGIDPDTGHHYDDTKRYVDQLKGSESSKTLQDLRRQRAPRLSEAGQMTEETQGATMSASMRILDIPKRPDPRLVAELGKMVTPHLSDSMERLYAGGPQLRPMHKAGKLAGPAFTVKTTPGDNLLVHKALDTAKPGDVIVVDAGGFWRPRHHRRADDVARAAARRRGHRHLGRDPRLRRDRRRRPIRSSPARRHAPRPYKNGPGEINVPISMGGMAVIPGDIIVGDADGLVAMPQEQAERILASAKAILEKETAAMKEIDGRHGRPRLGRQGAEGKGLQGLMEPARRCAA